MPRFAYRALDPEGRLVEGVADGSTMDAVAKDLGERGFRIQNLSTAESAPPPRQVSPEMDRRSVLATDVAGPLIGKVDLAHLAFFFRQLAAMLSAGINPAQALMTLATQVRSSKLSLVIREMANGAQEGRPLTATMQRYPEVFSLLVLNLVKAGEEGGFLDKALTQVAEYIEQEIKLRTVLRRVTMYPKIVIVASIFIIIAANFIIGMVAPQSDIRVDSPLTRIGTWMWLLPILVFAFLFVRIGLQNPRIRQNWELMILALPGLGTTSRQFAMAKFGRAFGALYKAGVPLHRSFKLAADACGNDLLRARMQPAIQELETGMGVADAFRMTQAFNPIVLDMVETGERTGNLDLMLNKMAEYYESEAETRSMQAAMLFGVVCLLAVGAYVAFIYITNIMNVGTSYQKAIDE